MTETVSDVEPELRVLPRTVILVPFVLAHLILILSDGLADVTARAQAQGLGLAVYVLSAAGWWLSEWQERVARWLIVVTAALAVQWAAALFQQPQYLVLMAIPTGVAALLLGAGASMATALGQTVTLAAQMWLISPNLPLLTAVLSLVANWTVAGTAIAIRSRAVSLTRWSWQHFERAQILLDDARTQKADLEQALDDLEHANRQLALAGERMAILRTAAEEARKNKTAFVIRVSHEFRSPVNIIMGIADLMLRNPEVYDGAFPPQALHHLQIIHRNCQHLSDMVDDVLDLTQAEGGKMRFYRSLVQLERIVIGATEVVRPLLDEKRLNLDVMVPSDLPPVFCDETRVRQVILNLLGNAARFTEKGGVTIRAQHDSQRVIVSVSDTGSGIAKEDAEHIFEPFTQAMDRSMRGARGSGLGLSISREFIELHGGRMWLESELGTGTTVFFTLPLNPLADHVVQPGHQIREDWIWREDGFRTDRAVSSERLMRARVLVYDETGGVHAQLKRFSDEIELIDLDGLDGLMDELNHCPAHAVVVNTMEYAELRPLVDRLTRIAPDTPVIGCCVPQEMQQAIEAGALDYLVKPVAPDDLRRVFEMLDESLERVLIVDDDEDTQELMRMYTRAYDACIEVEVAGSGDEALNLIASHVPDLVLLDIVMAPVDGWQVLAAMRAHETLCEIPVIVISGQDPRGAAATPLILVAAGTGLSGSKLMACLRQLPKVLMQPD